MTEPLLSTGQPNTASSSSSSVAAIETTLRDGGNVVLLTDHNLTYILNIILYVLLGTIDGFKGECGCAGQARTP